MKLLPVCLWKGAPMKVRLFSCLLVLFSGLFVLNLQADEKILIDTDFSKATADHLPLAAKEVKSPAGLPMVVPTSQTETVAALPPSTVVVAREDRKGMKAPFAHITVKPKNPEDLKPGEYPFAEAGLVWRFPGAPMNTGKYEATWTLLPLTDLKNLKMAFILVHEQADGSQVKIEPSVKPNEIPLMVIASGDKLSAGEAFVELKTNKPNEIRLEFDMTLNIWSAELNGKRVIRDKKFPDGYLAQFPTFSAIAFGFQGGATDEGQGCEYAVGPVKVVKLEP